MFSITIGSIAANKIRASASTDFVYENGLDVIIDYGFHESYQSFRNIDLIIDYGLHDNKANYRNLEVVIEYA